MKAAFVILSILSLAVSSLVANENKAIGIYTTPKLSLGDEIIAPDLTEKDLSEFIGFHAWRLLVKHGRVAEVENIYPEYTSRNAFNASFSRWVFNELESGMVLITLSENQERTVVFSSEDLDNDPKILTRAKASYPHGLRAVIPWYVDVEVIVDEFGVPQSVEVSASSNKAFEENGRIAALMHRFDVGMKNGLPVAYKKKIRVEG